MQRRKVLRTLALLPLLSGGLAALLGLTHAAAQPIAPRRRVRVRPSDPAWPDAASWAQLKDAVAGNLIEVRALFGACDPAPHDPACREALQNIGNPFWIADQPAGTEVSGWLDAWTPAAGAYAVKARNAADVAAAISFARERHLRLVIKGGGHSYLGCSNAPDSLLIWTRAMNKVSLHDSFVGQGCEGRVAPVPAVSAEAGAVWMDLYNTVTTAAGRYVQGGSCTTVGVAGLVQSGGFSLHSKAFGTAAAGLLEAEVVTADGQVRVVNACTDSDLFWALKGGGGGTFGVVTRVTLRTHSLPQFFGGAWCTIKARSAAAFQSLIAHFVAFYDEQLGNAHWGGNIEIGPDNRLDIGLATQGLDAAQTGAACRAFFEWVEGSPGDFTVTQPFHTAAGDPQAMWDVDKNPFWTRDMRADAPRHHAWGKGDQGEVGAFLHGYDSLWLPASLLRAEHRKQLADALFAASRYKLVRLHLSKGLAGAPPEVRAAVLQTATNPAVVDAFTLVIIADSEAPAYPDMPRPQLDVTAARRDAHAIDLAAAELRRIAPGSGSYVSESNYFNLDWQNEYWGNRYPRLQAIKKKYDPDGLFYVRHGVGSEDWSADGFTRFG